MIPKLIHFVWFGPEMPGWARRNIEEFRRLNPEHEIRMHGEEALDPIYRPLYDPLVQAAEKCDFIRMSVLERFGGWYFDVDFWPLRPLADAEFAWRLDGSRLYVGEQATQKSVWWFNAAVMAIGPGWRGWPILREMALHTVRRQEAARDAADGWGAFGPKLVTRFARLHPDLVENAGRAWWYGADTKWAGKLYRLALAGKTEPIRRFLPETCGQLPFGLHLWAYKFADRIEGSEGRASRSAIVCNAPAFFKEQPSIMDSVGRGLAGLGYRIERAAARPDAIANAENIPDLVAIWNGVRESSGIPLVTEARRLGARILFLEHGFWRRNEYTQCDLAGNQHRSSWAGRLRERAPADGARRLERFYPQGIVPMRARQDGYVLVLGQVPMDSQLWDSELQGPLPLQRAVKGALVGYRGEVYFRPHPQCSNQRTPRNKVILPLMPGDGASEAATYKVQKSGTGLVEALKGARFVITINSTAGNEALAMGVPVLAFGPALYTAAGVARATSTRTIRGDIEAMVRGWAPEAGAVRNYLEWLAARQWTAEELADPAVVSRILGLESPGGQEELPQSGSAEPTPPKQTLRLRRPEAATGAPRRRMDADNADQKSEIRNLQAEEAAG